jgi:phosphate-selective porin OprO and OprP
MYYWLMVVSPTRSHGFSVLFASALLSYALEAQAQTPSGTPPPDAAVTPAPPPADQPVPPRSTAPNDLAPPPSLVPTIPPPSSSPTAAPPAEPPTPPGEGTERNPRPNELPSRKFNEASKFVIASADDQNRLEFHALIDADGRWFLTDKAGVNTFLIRRARPSIDARVFKYLELTLQPEFAGSKFQILDAYANLRFLGEVQLRAGKMKPPVGLERLQSSRDTFFPETSLPSQLVPNRDVGAQLHGNAGNGTFEWALGLFNGVPNGQVGDQDNNDSKDVEGRLFFQPFIPTDIAVLRGLGFGVAGTIGNEQGAAVAYQTAAQTPFFTYASSATALGKRTLVTPQAYYYAGPVGAMFEFVRVDEHWVNPQGAQADVGTTAWQLTLGAALGGEETFRGVQVKHPIDPAKGDFGAFEVGARYGDLRVGDMAFERGFANKNSSAQRATEWGLVGTWHLATWNHLRIAYDHTAFRGGAPHGGDKKPESLIDTRLQIAF